MPADDERQRFARGDVHIGADFAHTEQGFLQPGDFGVGLRVFAVVRLRVGLAYDGVARNAERGRGLLPDFFADKGHQRVDEA